MITVCIKMDSSSYIDTDSSSDDLYSESSFEDDLYSVDSESSFEDDLYSESYYSTIDIDDSSRLHELSPDFDGSTTVEEGSFPTIASSFFNLEVLYRANIDSTVEELFEVSDVLYTEGALTADHIVYLLKWWRNNSDLDISNDHFIKILSYL